MEDLTNVTFLEPADGVRCIKDGGCSECEHNQTCEHPANWCRPMPDGSDLGKLLKWVERAAKQSLLYNLPEKAREGWPDAIKRAQAAEAEVERLKRRIAQLAEDPPFPEGEVTDRPPTTPDKHEVDLYKEAYRDAIKDVLSILDEAGDPT